MIIKRNISFFLQKVYNTTNNGECQIRLRVRWGGNVLQFNSGFMIDSKKWDAVNSRCKRNAVNGKGYSSADINKELNHLADLAHEVFKQFEVQEHEPDKQEYKEAFNVQCGKVSDIERKTLDAYMLEFCLSQGSMNSWAEATYKKFNTLKNHLIKFRKGLRLSDFQTDTLMSFIEYLRDTAGLQNTSIIKMWKNLHWFLRWASDAGYLKNDDFRKFNPRLKTVTDKEVVFLTWEELMAVYSLNFPEGKKYLERVRDVFCFQCFTSLRYSDVSNLKHEDIADGLIRVVTEKTGDTISINLNKYSAAILEKYKNEEKPLPVVSNQKMNKWIKEICFIAGIDQPMTTVYYKGAERIEETHPKYELIGTHTGRRTFICNALTMGISPATVMEWTGHSDYKAMRPYIKIADRAKAEAMEKFNR